MMNEPITFHKRTGQTMAEYAVVLGVITFAIVTTFSLLSDAINGRFDADARDHPDRLSSRAMQ